MSETKTTATAGDLNAVLQFEKAEFRPIVCTTCTSEVAGEYYTINSYEVCQSCRDRTLQFMTGGSKIRRFIKATLYGSGAALLGCGIYYGVLALTGLEVGLISILVGVLVGSAVKAGSEHRGGLAYQLLAVFLTYTAIVSAYIPLIVAQIQTLNTKMTAEEKATPKPATPAKTKTPDTAAAQPASSPAPALNKAALTVETNETPEITTVGEFALAIAVLIGLLYALPFLAGLQNIISLLIIGFGLYQAWSINTRIQDEIKGPFTAPPRPAPPIAGEAAAASV